MHLWLTFDGVAELLLRTIRVEASLPIKVCRGGARGCGTPGGIRIDLEGYVNPGREYRKRGAKGDFFSRFLVSSASEAAAAYFWR